MVVHENRRVEAVKAQVKGTTTNEAVQQACAYVLAETISRLFPEATAAWSSISDEGFFCDFANLSLSAHEFASIEAQMHKQLHMAKALNVHVVSRDEAMIQFQRIGNAFKVEQLERRQPDEMVTLCERDGYLDLLSSPISLVDARAGAFHLTSIAGAYWLSDASREQLTRVYGVAFASREEQAVYVERMEEAKRRDHRRLGRELELFMFTDAAPGMPIFLPNGLHVRNALESFERDLQTRHGYIEVKTPVIMDRRLWEQSGHWAHYRENMYTTAVDDAVYALKPMNCPGHMLIYASQPRSYRELPIRIAEYGHVHRHEQSGALGGMMRVRSFTQDDAHIFCRLEDLDAELTRVLELIDEIYRVFGFSYRVELSTRPEHSMGSDELWEQAERALHEALNERAVSYRMNPGDGAFYGPKIDFHIQDAMGRQWQCATVQLDFQLPERFDLTYIDEQNEHRRPIVIHRAVFGSVDRFMGILTEHFDGAFPVWCAPQQVRVLSISDAYFAYAREVQSQLQDAGIRVALDVRSEKIGYKIRESQQRKHHTRSSSAHAKNRRVQ